jgi:rhodanese-related sulfurtransferase
VTEETAESLELEPARAAELIQGGAQAVDVRTAEEYAAGHIEGAVHVPLERLDAETGGLDHDRPIVFYCRAGNRSGMAAEAFSNSGWDAHNVAGGLLAWAEDGLPLEPEDGTVAESSNLPPP